MAFGYREEDLSSFSRVQGFNRPRRNRATWVVEQESYVILFLISLRCPYLISSLACSMDSRRVKVKNVTVFFQRLTYLCYFRSSVSYLRQGSGTAMIVKSSPDIICSEQVEKRSTSSDCAHLSFILSLGIASCVCDVCNVSFVSLFVRPVLIVPAAPTWCLRR
jgi:hypothetical protein